MLLEAQLAHFEYLVVTQLHICFEYTVCADDRIPTEDPPELITIQMIEDGMSNCLAGIEHQPFSRNMLIAVYTTLNMLQRCPYCHRRVDNGICIVHHAES
jgi:hypothetical protein